MNKQQLANKIWESANRMRSKIEANEYKDYILGFIFYKYLSDKEIAFLKENDYIDEYLPTVTEDDPETVSWVQRNIGYFIAYPDLFSSWLKMGPDFDVSNVTDALSAFSRLISPSHKKVFDRIFDTLQTGLSKLGDTSGARTKAILGLLQLIKDIPMDNKQDYDVLGFVYEYLISNFAANAGKKAGEFYTPHEVSLLMSEIVADHLRGRSQIKIYDPTSGSGSLLITIGQSAAKYMDDANNIKYYAQELKENTYNLTRMNLIMRGISPDNIVTRNGDTLEDDWPYFDENDKINTYDPLYVDAVVSNPPYSQQWDPTNKESDARYSRYGLAPKGKADYAFLLHDLYHIKPDGIMTIVLPHGVLFRGGEEGTIRKNLVENNNIDAIIGLPANIFFGTGIPTIIMVLKQKRENSDILIIDASKGFVKEGKNNKLRASDIQRIADVVRGRSTVKKFSRVVPLEEIRQNDYNLNIPRYVDSSEKADSWDIYASMFGGIPVTEIDELQTYWNAFPNLKTELFGNANAAYVQLQTKDLKKTLRESGDIASFRQSFERAFDSFPEYLRTELIDNMSTVSITKEKAVISKQIFQAMSNLPLIDPYDAFQILDDNWNRISQDLEIIQTEGTDAITKVDPNMVLKKKNNNEEEVQEGWVGHVIPFDLVQKTLLKDDFSALNEKEIRLSEIPSEEGDIFEQLTEDEKETCSEALNDDNSAFVAKSIPGFIKELKKEDQTEETVTLLEKLSRFDQLTREEKALKSETKRVRTELEQHTKETIEQLPASAAQNLLYQKWIQTLIDELAALPDGIISGFENQLTALQDKYSTTLLDVEQEIKETEKKLCGMMDDLEGNEFDMKGLQEFKILLEGD